MLHDVKMTQHGLLQKRVEHQLTKLSGLEHTRIVQGREQPNLGYADIELVYLCMDSAGCTGMLSLCVCDDLCGVNHGVFLWCKLGNL